MRPFVHKRDGFWMIGIGRGDIVLGVPFTTWRKAYLEANRIAVKA